jgi:discoidin domain receptor family protein 2
MTNQVFNYARVFFSIGGRYYDPNPITAYYAPDEILEHPRFVKIKLKNRIGKFIKVQLFYASRWMMVSEVFFVSGSICDFLLFIIPNLPKF